MARRRFFPPPVIGVGRSTRAQSVARSTFTPVFGAPPPPIRRAFDDSYVGHGHVPFKPFIHSHYDTSGSENFTRSEINRELLLTTNAMEDNYDIVNMSRSKDKDVLSRANRAIANTEIHSTPRSAVAARRVMMRGHSTPPDYISKTVTQKTEVALALARAKNIVKQKPLPPASVRHHPRIIVKPRYKVHRYVPTHHRYVSSVSSARKEYGLVDTVEQTRRAPLSVLAYLRYLIRNQYKPYVAKAAYTKAALLGRKVDVVTPAGRRRPKSKYAQNKLREMRKEQRESQSYSPEDTRGLKASRPVPFQLARRIWDPELSYNIYRFSA